MKNRPLITFTSRVDSIRRQRPTYIGHIFVFLLCIVALVSTNTAQTSSYLYVSNFFDNRIAVYDQDFVLKHHIHAFDQGGTSGLDFLSNGNLVVAGWDNGRIRIFDPTGAIVSDFTHNLGYVWEVKAGSADRLYVTGGGDIVNEITTTGTFLRSFPTQGDSSVAVLPGNILWTGSPYFYGFVDVFDLVTGNKVSTMTLDNGQGRVDTMSYNAASNTVLMCDGTSGRIYERSLSGTLVQTFPQSICIEGITRGANGDIYSIYRDDWGSTIYRWAPNGDYLGAGGYGAGEHNIVSAPHLIPGTPLNQAPVLSNVPSTATINEGSDYSFTATAADPDGDNLTFVLYNAPAGASIDPVTGVFTWQPTESQGPSSYSFAVGVLDDDPRSPMTDYESISISINEINSAPVLAPIGNQSGSPRRAIRFTATASDPDIAPNTLTFSLVGAPSGASINPASGAFSWTPGKTQIGEYTFIVRVTDNGTPTLSDEQTVTVTVRRSR